MHSAGAFLQRHPTVLWMPLRYRRVLRLSLLRRALCCGVCDDRRMAAGGVGNVWKPRTAHRDVWSMRRRGGAELLLMFMISVAPAFARKMALVGRPLPTNQAAFAAGAVAVYFIRRLAP